MCLATTDGLEKRHERRPPLVDPEAHADRRPFLAARSASRPPSAPGSTSRASSRSSRAACSVSPGNEAHLHAFRTELVEPDLTDAPALSAHLARARLQKAAGGRRGEDLRLRTRVPQSRARRPARPRVHHARMVPRRCALRGADGRLRGAVEARRRDGRQPLRLLARGDEQSARRAGAADGRRSVRALCRHRSPRHRRRRRQRQRRARRRGRGRRHRTARRRHLGRHLRQAADGTDRAEARQRPRDAADRLSGERSAARARLAPTIRASPSASSSTAAASSWPTASAS